MTQHTIAQRLLFLSNGSGEDAINGKLIRAWRRRYPQVELAAMPIVGEGATYRHLDVPIICPTQTMPSGGVFYMQPIFFVKDLAGGLLKLTWQQYRAIRRYAAAGGAIMATGDNVVAAFAHLSHLPYTLYLAGYSSYYTGQLQLGWISPWLLQSNASRCLHVFTRDRFTAQDLQRQGWQKTSFVGNPIMDDLQPQGNDLNLARDGLMIALLPGSRLPEAMHNLALQLRLVAEIATSLPSLQFRAAMVPDLLAALPQMDLPQGWHYESGALVYRQSGVEAKVQGYSDAFADILYRASLVIGMTGTATEQAVGLGKPVVTVPGVGPAFTYRFANAQQRLLGPSFRVIGEDPADPENLPRAAQCIVDTLADAAYLQRCRRQGAARLGQAGGSDRIVDYLATMLGLRAAGEG
jgi:uncharacterized protein (TIGR03492 family)